MLIVFFAENNCLLPASDFQIHKAKTYVTQNLPESFRELANDVLQHVSHDDADVRNCRTRLVILLHNMDRLRELPDGVILP